MLAQTTIRCTLLLSIAVGVSSALAEEALLVGRIVDSADGRALPARVYIISADGKPYLTLSQSTQSTSFYDRMDRAVGTREAYSCVGALPFRAKLPAGKYSVTIERGKEYVPLTKAITLSIGQTHEEGFRLVRAFNLNIAGWYSGDLHVHTPLTDLGAAQLADDLNVAFPITAWANDSQQKPMAKRGGPVPVQGALAKIDETHVFWNLNTEYEIFTVKKKHWTQGALLILGHQTPFDLTAPPVKPIAEEAHRQGAILDWDKHSWPWSSMLVPVAGIDTIELTNNHMWRQKPRWSVWEEKPASWMHWTDDATGWAEYGFQTYYALLNCGFVLRPGAGTANGVHPVPLGHSRVYVKVDGPFTYEKWLDGLKQGRSFATNGPALLMTVNGMTPGDRQVIPSGRATQIEVLVQVNSTRPLQRLEVIVNGNIASKISAPSVQSDAGTWWKVRVPVDIAGSSWIAARCFEAPDKDNIRFAHTGPVFFDDPQKPLLPEKRQIEFLVDSVKRQIARNSTKLDEESLAEYALALQDYGRIAKRLKEDGALEQDAGHAGPPK